MNTKTKINFWRLLNYKCRMTKQRRIDRTVNVAIILLFALMIGAAVIGFTEQKALADLPVSNVNVPDKKPEQPNLKLYSKDEAIKRIKEIADERDFEWPDYLLKLISCETGGTFDQFAINKVSSATGACQIIDGNKLTRAQRYDLDYAVNWTIDRINEGHQSWWACDKLIKSNPNKYALK